MQKEFLIETRAVADEKGNMLNLKYYLIEEEQPQATAPLYRICIKKSMAEKPGVEEAESTPPVSHSEVFARQMLRQLITNAVTPVCLLEIVDDIMSVSSPNDDHGAQIYDRNTGESGQAS